MVTFMRLKVGKTTFIILKKNTALHLKYTIWLVEIICNKVHTKFSQIDKNPNIAKLNKKSYIGKCFVLMEFMYVCVLYPIYFSFRLREHVEDKNKLPILIFPEGMWKQIMKSNAFTSLLSFITCKMLTKGL